jgi:hypothetical protein
MMNRALMKVREAGVQFLGTHLQRRTKRLIFLASFSARVKDEQVFDDPTLEKLNELMKLGADDAALKLPIHLSKVIWRGKTIEDICGDTVLRSQLTPDTLDAAVERIVSAMPAWLRYGRQGDVQKDLKKLLVHRRILTA